VRKFFFFEKKKQKTFVRLARRRSPPRVPDSQSLFASFSSEKEDLAPFPTMLFARSPQKMLV